LITIVYRPLTSVVCDKYHDGVGDNGAGFYVLSGLFDENRYKYNFLVFNINPRVIFLMKMLLAATFYVWSPVKLVDTQFVTLRQTHMYHVLVL
jgi:hypothetical protein